MVLAKNAVEAPITVITFKENIEYSKIGEHHAIK